MRQFLSKILQSLDQLEVRGRANMDILLGCILAIERMIAELDALANPPAEEPEEAKDG